MPKVIKRNWDGLALIALLVVGWWFAMGPERAKALARGVRSVETCTIACNDAGAKVDCDSGSTGQPPDTVAIWNLGTTAAYLAEYYATMNGAYLTEGALICDDADVCPTSWIPIDAANYYCYGNNVTVRVHAGRVY